ncbi:MULTISPECIES: hypothetical protein [unclassified Pseudonocardia]|uniref:hypothetical protein n=1 Tax=unclassified Pseudonocardia TaxID=2619320 RepID=UPI00031109C5|nr:hypothetical protein [Pseudonocardia sp. Ae707_Ps1]OLM16497.1 hypothetical protein Ae707Ps1_0755c [Pseudonocardia sp. Ae707_Ps1]
MTAQTGAAQTGTVQDALFGEPAVVETAHHGPAATQDPREVARLVGLAQDPGLFLVERSGQVLRADPAQPGRADPVARHDGDTVAQLLDSGHLKLGGTHHLQHAGNEGPARSVLVPRTTRDMVSRWDHLRPIPESAPPPETKKQPQRSTGVIGVDVVEPGKALVTLGGAGHGGTVLRDGARYRVENDHGTHIGHASSYRAAARLLARYHGFTPGPVEIEHEHRTYRR